MNIGAKEQHAEDQDGATQWLSPIDRQNNAQPNKKNRHSQLTAQ
jgi:hypothetical protein